MSHSVNLQLEINDITKEVNLIKNQSICCIDKLISENENNKELIDFLEKQKEQIIEQEKELSKYQGISKTSQSNAFNVRKKLDSISKKVANIISNKNIVDFVIKQSEKEEKEILEIILKEGVIANNAISNLRKENKELSKKNILEEIEKIRNSNLEQEESKKIKKDLFKYIDDQEFKNDNLEFELKKIIDSKNSLQELNDCFAYISSKKNEEIKIDELASLLFNELESKEKFKLLDNVEKQLDTDGILRKKFKLRNQKGNTIEIIIDGNLRIKYQLGNYVGHACEKTSEKIFESINKMGYTIVHKTISRNISNSKPLEMKKNFNN